VIDKLNPHWGMKLQCILPFLLEGPEQFKFFVPHIDCVGSAENTFSVLCFFFSEIFIKTIDVYAGYDV
jgi:hypothetical protein